MYRQVKCLYRENYFKMLSLFTNSVNHVTLSLFPVRQLSLKGINLQLD